MTPNIAQTNLRTGYESVHSSSNCKARPKQNGSIKLPENPLAYVPVLCNSKSVKKYFTWSSTHLLPFMDG